MHESISASQAVKADAGPAREGVFADFVVLDFEPGGRLVDRVICSLSKVEMDLGWCNQKL